jgi:hypothetical protein
VCKLLACLILIFVFSEKLFGESDIKDESNIIFGITGGKTDVLGYYKDELSSGYNFSIFVDYPFNNNRFLYLGSVLSYTKLSLKETSLSGLSNYSFGIGPVIYVPLGIRFKPYAGIMPNINYFELTTVKTHKQERTVKIGAAAKIGFTVPQYMDFAVNFGLKYSFNELSGKDFQNVTYYAGISYFYNFIPQDKAERNIKLIETDEYYELGLKYFKIGDGLKAKENFNKVSNANSHYKEVENYLSIISSNEKNYNKALQFISENKLYEALPLLIEAEKYLVSAFEKLREIRLLLLKEEDDLVKKGVDAYNKEDYEKCIFFMRRVQLINPGNESVNLYLPRAIKRYDAIKKIE